MTEAQADGRETGGAVSAMLPGVRRHLGYTGIDEDVPPPPYQAVADFVILGVRWTEGVRALLPPELRPIPGLTGTFHVFVSKHRGVISPFGACFACIEVEGYDSPGGSHGYYIVTGHCDGRAGVMYRRRFNGNFLEGGARHEREGDLVVGIGGSAGVDGIRVAMRPGPPLLPEVNGVHHFMGPDPAGKGINVYPISFTGVFRDALPVSVDILSGATERMKLMQPAELVWGIYSEDLTVNYGVPRLASEKDEIARDGLRALLLEVFSHLGRPAAVIGRDGRVVIVNRQCEQLAGGGFPVERGKRPLNRREDRTALDSLLRAAAGRGTGAFDLSPIAVDRPDGRPLLVQALPLDPVIAGPDAALVIFSDPASPASAAPAGALQLLGLTPSQARLAAAIGAGTSPREAGEMLGITEHTARSSLKTIYEKLGINKQTELARIVTRLEVLGP